MPTAIQFLRSSTQNLRPNPVDLSEGMPMVQLNESDPGLYFRLRNSELCKIGPCSVGIDPPNSSPVLEAGNTIGEFWLDTSGSAAILKVWDGDAWVVTNSPTSAVSSFQQVTDVGTTSTHSISVSGLSVNSLNFPTSDGLPNQVMVTDGSGNISFANQSAVAAPAGNNTEVQFNNNGTLAGTPLLAVTGGQVQIGTHVVPDQDNTWSFGSDGQRIASMHSTVLDVTDGGADAGSF